MASSSGTGREYPPELVHGELCRTRFNINAECDCGKSEPAASSGTGHDAAKPITSFGPHRDDVLLAKVLRARARLGLIARVASDTRLLAEIRLLDEVIEELTNDA